MLDGIKMLEELSGTDRSNLEIFCQQKFLKEGEVLFEEGQEANALYLLIEGRMEIYKYNGIKNVILGTIEAEEILGEMAVFGNIGKRMASAKATEDTILITILSFSMKKLTKKHPAIMQKIQNLIEKRIYENKMKNL